MKMKDALKKKGMFVKKLPNQGELFRKQWEHEFADALSASQKKKIYMDEFLWHAFSYEKLPCLQGEQAVQAFEQQAKYDCYLFFEHEEEVLKLSKCRQLTNADLSGNTNMYLEDLYVVDKDFTWTYVITHESSCGPYFYRT
ncbi:DUF4275 family protein [Priestia aryabhattai]|nr:DUF4275 domain-containing protein [Priestia megaterium]PHF76103.1 hypothetical protein COI42_06920 [Priestia aryabhattai]QSF34622.1 DUF4275 family protein [Priestia megaterium]